jgi:hypothetical protein
MTFASPGAVAPNQPLAGPEFQLRSFRGDPLRHKDFA